MWKVGVEEYIWYYRMGDHLESQETSQSVCLINIDALSPVIVSLNRGWIVIIIWLGAKKNRQNLDLNFKYQCTFLMKEIKSYPGNTSYFATS